MKPFSIVYMTQDSMPRPSSGLNVLICDLIKGLTALNVPVHIYTTKKHSPSLINSLRTNQISENNLNIKILTLPGENQDLQNSNIVDSIPNHNTQPRTRSWSKLILLAIPYWIAKEIIFKFKRLLSKLFPISTQKFISVRNYIRYQKLDKFQQKIHCEHYSESQAIASQLMAMTDVERLFFGTAFESDLIIALKGKKIITTFPDAVPLLFPTFYPLIPPMKRIMSNIAKSVQSSQGIICYSQFSLDSQLTALLTGVLEKPKIAVIPSGFYTQSYPEESIDLNQYVSKDFFPNLGSVPYQQFGHFQYILYPTADRPHKNLLTAIKALEELSRKRYANIKLIVTSPDLCSENREYIQNNKLHYDIIFTPELPLPALNQLIRNASLVIHPSLFEGGDIFNFSRAISNDCPALLSDIPVAREMFERHGINKDQYGPWLFDPLDADNLANLIENSITQRDQLLAEQKKVFSKMSHYDFVSMAKKYYEFYWAV